MRFLSRFCWILERKEYLENVNNLPKHYGAGPPEARGTMQLHRLKAGPVTIYLNTLPITCLPVLLCCLLCIWFNICVLVILFLLLYYVFRACHSRWLNWSHECFVRYVRFSPMLFAFIFRNLILAIIDTLVFSAVYALAECFSTSGSRPIGGSRSISKCYSFLLDREIIALSLRNKYATM